MIRQTKLRAAAAIAVLGAMTLAGCGGGGSKSMLPIAANGATAPASSARTTTGYLSVTLPNAVSAQSSKRQVTSLAKTPLYIDTTTANSALVVTVAPQDPAEAAQYGNLTVCYNLYTNGVLAANNAPNFVVISAGGIASSVTVGIPSPPGTDGFQITQYAGQCSGAYGIPAVPAGVAGNGILSQTPVVYAYMVPGASNNLNGQVAGCAQPVGPVTPAFNCPTVTNPAAGPYAPLTSAVTVANIGFGTLPITSPVREQSQFILANGKIGIPIPLEGLNAAGAVIPGTPATGSGIFPLGVVLSLTETGSGGAHTLLNLVDATNGGIAQQGATLTIHEFNALSDGTVPNPAGGFVPTDITFGGSTAVVGHPYVIVLTYDGTDATLLTSVKVTATPAVASGIAAKSITIAPQSAVYTAGGTGYTDASAPTSAAGLIQAAGNVYFTDASRLKIDGPGFVQSPATGTNLTGLTYAQWPTPTTPVASFVYAVDQAAVGASSAVQVASGLYAFDPATLAATPVSAQAGSGNWVVFNAPVAVVQAPSIAGKYYVFVVDKTGAIYRVDIANNGAAVGGFQVAANVSPPIVTSGTALSPGTAKYLGTAVTAGGAILVADPGNNRIAQIDASVSPAVITTFASGAPFTGLSQVGTAVYATSTTGQVYYISAAGAAPVSFGFTTAAAGAIKDGPLGQLATFTPTAATVAPVPTNYLLQFQGGSFFDTVGPTVPTLAAPYTVLPFPAANTKAFAAAPVAGVGLRADTSAGAATAAGTVHADGGILVIPTTVITGANNNLTSNSLLFTDSGKLRTLVK